MTWHLLILLFSTQANQVDVVTVKVPNSVIKAGTTSTFIIQISVKQGFHIQANQIKDEFLIPTTVAIESSENIKPGKALFPKPNKFRLEGTNDWMEVYDSSFQIKIPVKVGKQMERGSYNFKAELRYQACDAKTCFFPKTIVFAIPCQVE